jgi:integrase
MAVSKKRDGRWFVYYRVKGKLKHEYFGRGAEAEAAARARDDELAAGRVKRRPRKADYGPAFAELAKAYLDAKAFSESSRQNLRIRLEAKILPFFGALPAIRITDADMDKYIGSRRAGGVKYSTIIRELSDVKAILNWCVRRRPPLLAFNPVANYKKPAPDYDIIQPPTASEAAAIMAAASHHLQRAIMLSWYLGLRPGAVELLRMTWDQVDLENKTILVISARKGGPVSRLVPIMSETFLEQLKSWHVIDKAAGLDYLVTFGGKPIKKIQTCWKSCLRRAGIKRRLRPYDLRHHFVTRALESGADIKALANVVGSRPETLMRHYQHVTASLEREAVAKIPELRLPDAMSSTIQNKYTTSVPEKKA